jgi:phosphoenolpyruvate carboxykinase (GTP)
MGDYFGHWLSIGAKADPAKLPRIYFVNWFRKDERGKFVWPGYGENARVLKWIAERLEGRAEAVDTPIGRLPAKGALDVEGLDLTDQQLDLLLTVDATVWKEEARLIPAHYEKFGERLPQELWDEFDALNERLEAFAEAVTERSGGKISLLPVGNHSVAPYTRPQINA